MPPRSTRVRAPLFGALALALVACGGANVEPVTPVTDKPVAKAAPAPDVSPVAEPEGLIGVARIANLDQSLRIASSWVSLPLPDRDALLRSVTDEHVAGAVDLGQPVDGAVAFTKDLRGAQAAFSVAVRSIDEAKAKLEGRYRVKPGAAGQFVVEGIGGGPDEDDAGLACLLTPAPTGGRLVCGDSRGAVDRLGPYLARTVSREPWSSAVHIEVRPEALSRAYESLHVPTMARMLLGQQGPAVSALIDGFAHEVGDVLSDSQRMAFDVRLQEERGTVEIVQAFRGKKSVLARVLTGNSSCSSGAPAAFWHLPADATGAGYSCPGDLGTWAHPLALLGDALVEAAPLADVPASEIPRVRELLVDRAIPKLLLSATLHASGVNAEALASAKAALAAAPEGPKREAAARTVLVQKLGWRLWRTDSALADVGPILKDTARLTSSPAFAAWLKKATDGDVKVASKVTPLPAAYGLPKDAVHVAFAVTPKVNGKALKGPLPDVHLIAVPDEGKTWVGLGLDLKQLSEHAKVALSSSPTTGTLQENAAIAKAVKEANAGSAIFVTAQGLLSTFADQLPSLPRAKDGPPVVLAGSVQGPSPTASAGTHVSTVTVPREIVSSIASALMSFAMAGMAAPH